MVLFGTLESTTWKTIIKTMTKVYRAREGTITAIDTKTMLATTGSETAPGPLLVPNSAKKLTSVIVAGVSDLSAAADAAFFIRLEGPGLKDGPEVIAVGADGAQVATGGQAARIAEIIDLNIDVIPNQEIIVFGEMVGEDMGQITLAATLVFEI